MLWGLLLPPIFFFFKKAVTPPHGDAHSLLLFPLCRLVSWWRLCHSILVTKREVSASSLLHHSACDRSSSTLLRRKRKIKNKKRRTERRKERRRREIILVYGELYPSKQPCLSPPAIVAVNWRSQSTSWVLSVFACHLVRCGGAEEKRNESSAAHITGGSSGLSASVSKNPKPKEREKKKTAPTKKKSSGERRKKDLPYAL